MGDWEKFNEVLLAEKEYFCSHLNKEDVTAADYAHAKRVCKNFEFRSIGEYNDLHFQSSC